MNTLAAFETITDPESIALLTTSLIGLFSAICMGIKSIREAICGFIKAVKDVLKKDKKC